MFESAIKSVFQLFSVTKRIDTVAHTLNEFGLCTLPSSEPQAGTRPEVGPEVHFGSRSLSPQILLSCYISTCFYDIESL